MDPGLSYHSFTFEDDSSAFEWPASRLEFLGRGGGSDVFKLKGSDHIALKIYRENVTIDWAKVNYEIKHPIHRRAAGVSTRGYAWPLLAVKSGGKRVGIVMPCFESQTWISLDNWVEQHLIERLDDDNNSLSRRILILRNLAKRLAVLHAGKIAVVDLRPSNVLVHRRTGDVALIDCDSFRVTTADGTVFPGTHVSAGYILPEAVGSKLNVSMLDEDQDRYAFAVIAFQVLNHGIHPFQGILKKEVPSAETNDEKAAKGLYPYMASRSAAVQEIVIPVLQSMHDAWPRGLRELFDSAFLTRARPALRAWHRYFTGVLTKRWLARCARFPTDVRHIRFRDCDCGICVRDAAVAHIRSLGTGPVAPEPAKQSPKRRLTVPAWGVALGVLTAALIVALIAVLVREQQLYETASRGNLIAVRSYIESCFFCARLEEIKSRAAMVERNQYNSARGNVADLSAYIESCFICTFKPAAINEVAQLREEGKRYHAASGDAEKLRAYLQNCQVCAFRAEATAELERIQREINDRDKAATVLRERRQYEAARGDAEKLQQYIRACQICEYGAAAKAEIASIEARRNPVVSAMVENQTPQSLALMFYSPRDRSRAWPGPNQHYVLQRAGSRSFNLSCVTGEKICYGAWLEQGGALGRYWGAGFSGEQSCSNCCYTCPGMPTVHIMLTEQNAEPPPPPTVIWEVKNAYSSALEIAFFSQTRKGHTWPDVGKAWHLEGLSTNSYKLNCQAGESICYGASPLDNSPFHWGAGVRGQESCTNCCYTCDGGRHQITLNYREGD